MYSLSKLRITLLHVAEEIFLMMFSTSRLRSWMHSGLFLYKFSLQYPHRKKSSEFRSGDRGTHEKSLFFETVMDVFRRSCWFWSSSSILAADCACFSKPANNVHNTFTRWCSSDIEILLNCSSCGYNWIGSNKKFEISWHVHPFYIAAFPFWLNLIPIFELFCTKKLWIYSKIGIHNIISQPSSLI